MSTRKKQLVINDTTGEYIARGPVSPDEIVATAKAILAARVKRPAALTNPNDVADYLVAQFANYEHEVFACLFLDQRHRLIAFQTLFAGTIDGCSAHPWEVVKAALRVNAAAVILAHNHPSGVAEPSRADEALTTRLKEALALVDVRVLDHFVVGGAATVSFATRGALCMADRTCIH
jgi:DNA repair protein RadC